MKLLNTLPLLILLVSSTLSHNDIADVSLDSGLTSADNSLSEESIAQRTDTPTLQQLTSEASDIEDSTPLKTKNHQTTLPKKKRLFDIDRFLSELDEFDCDKKKAGSGAFDEADSEFDQLCMRNLEDATFKPLGDFNIDQNTFFDYLRNNIYRPLAYNMQRKESLSGILNDLVFLDDSHSLIRGNVPKDNYGDFEERILKHFQTAEGKTSDMEKNQGEISNILIEILKEFHIYWNSLRYRGQIDKVKVDTKEVMRNILREYEIKEKFLYEVTKTLAGHIKDAYQRFITAHQSVRILNKKGASIIAEKMVQRYKSVVEAIKHSEFNYVKFVHEIALLVDMQQAYYIINYKTKVNEPNSMKNFRTQVFEQIKKAYEFIAKELVRMDVKKHEVKDFTATLLLKMTHSEFLIFQYYGISHIVNFSSSRLQSLSQTTVKVYYELLNNLMLIPKNCVNFLTLKDCAFHETNRILRLIGSKYMLKRSTGGWAIYQYVHDMMKMLYSKSNDLVYSNWTIFKAYFYQNLFAIMYNFKKRYLINDMDALEDLETLIGDTIDKFKHDNGTARINFGLIDELDEDLYYQFLDIKARFNHYTHIEKDPQILMQIQNELFISFKKFEQKYNSEINQDFITLMDHVKETVEEWKASALKAPQMSIQVSELPLHAANLTPQIFVDVNGHTGDKIDYSLDKNYRDIDPHAAIAQENEEKFNDFDERHQAIEEGIRDGKEMSEVLDEMKGKQPAPVVDSGDETAQRQDKEGQNQDKEGQNQEAAEGNQEDTEQRAENTNKDSKGSKDDAGGEERRKIRKERRLNTEETTDNQESNKTDKEGENAENTENGSGDQVSYDKVNLDAVTKGVKVPKKDMTIQQLVSPVERFEIVPQHFVESNHNPSVNDVSLESGVTAFDHE